MGKIPKRQRKFLRKNVLPHKKKFSRREVKTTKKQSAHMESDTSQEPRSSQPRREPKNLPHGLNAVDFLECPWLSHQTGGNEIGLDTCVDLFDPTKLSLDAPGDTRGLTELSVRAMVDRAVGAASVDDLLCVVWALKMAQDATFKGPQWLRPLRKKSKGYGSRALVILASEGFGRLHLAFRAHLGPERDPGLTEEEWEYACRAYRQQLEKSGSWPKLGGPLLMFLTMSLETLELVSLGLLGHKSGLPEEERREQDSISFILQGLSRMGSHIPFLFPFPRLAKRYLVYLLCLLGRTGDRHVLSLAFLRFYELSTSQPMPFLHCALKGVYWAYRAAVKRLSSPLRKDDASADGVAGFNPLPLLRECIAELFGVENPSAYLHAYVYIHELVRETSAAGAAGINRRGGAVSREAGMGLKRLRSWEFVQALQLWMSVLAANTGKNSLGPLVPALAKAVETTLQLSPGLYGAPRVLALARSAQEFAAATGVYLPTFPYLLDIFELLHKRPDSHSRPASSAAARGSHEPAICLPMQEAGREPNVEEEQKHNGTKQKSRSKGRGKGKRSVNDGVDKILQEWSQDVDFPTLAGFSKEDLRGGSLHAAMAREVINLIARGVTCCYRWAGALPEICWGIQGQLDRLLNSEFSSSDGEAGKCRARVRWLLGKLMKAAEEASSRRKTWDTNPGFSLSIETFRYPDEPTAPERLLAYKETCG